LENENVEDTLLEEFNNNVEMNQMMSRLVLEHRYQHQIMNTVIGSEYDGFSLSQLQETIQNSCKSLFMLIRKRLDRMAIEMRAPIFQRVNHINKRTEKEKTDFIERKHDILDTNISMFQFEMDSFPSKSSHVHYLTPCLYDDVDLYESLKGLQKNELY
jgi:hypothetical protein